MKIAHVSDLHIDAVNRTENYKNALHLLEFIREKKYDHLVISGDITENGDAASFELARFLFRNTGFLHKNRLTLTIGNHDIYGGVHLAEDIINYPRKCRSISFIKKVKQFEYYFREAFEGTLQNPENPFPFIKEFDNVVIAGFNSILHYSYLKNPFASNGRISLFQLNVFKELLKKASRPLKQLIALTHHHFNKETGTDEASGNTIWQAIERQTMKLRKKKKVIKKFSETGISLVLHGHLHENREYHRKKIKFLNSGGSVLGSNYLQFNEINTENNNIETKIIKTEKKIQTNQNYTDIFKNYLVRSSANPSYILN